MGTQNGATGRDDAEHDADAVRASVLLAKVFEAELATVWNSCSVGELSIATFRRSFIDSSAERRGSRPPAPLSPRSC